MKTLTTTVRIKDGIMARQKVVKLDCDRCKRTELRPLAELKEEGPIFQAEFKGKKIKYDDLCTTCEGVVETIWENICTPLTKASPRRKPRG